MHTSATAGSHEPAPPRTSPAPPRTSPAPPRTSPAPPRTSPALPRHRASATQSPQRCQLLAFLGSAPVGRALAAFAAALALASQARAADPEPATAAAPEPATAAAPEPAPAAAPEPAPAAGQPAPAPQWADKAELLIPNSSLSGAAQDQGKPLALDDLLELARKADPRARQAVAQAEHARQKREEVWWSWFPTFETTIGGGGPVGEAYLKGGNDSPTVDTVPHDGLGRLGIAIQAQSSAVLPLYTFGKLSAGNAAAGHALEAQQHLLARARDQAAYDMTRAYWAWQTTHFGLSSIEDVRRELRGTRDQAAKMLDQGSEQLTRSDLTRLDYAAEEVEAQHAAAVKQEALAITSIRLLLGMLPQDPIHIVRETLPPEPPGQPAYEEMVQLALVRRPEALAARENVLARRAQVELERARLFPDLGILATFNFNYQSNASSPSSPFLSNPNSRGYQVALGLKGTLDFPQKFARLRQAEADLQEAQALLAGAEGLLRLELQSALGDLAEARIRWQRAGREVAMGRRLLTQALLAIESGLGTAQDLVINTFLFSRAEGARLGAVYDAQMAWAALEKAVGARVPRPAQAPDARKDPPAVPQQ
jgi:outer membrane protein, multidrug efflux system